MALYTDTHTHTGRGDARRLTRILDTLRARLADAREVRRIENELAQMSDRELADIVSASPARRSAISPASPSDRHRDPAPGRGGAGLTRC